MLAWGLVTPLRIPLRNGNDLSQLILSHFRLFYNCFSGHVSSRTAPGPGVSLPELHFIRAVRTTRHTGAQTVLTPHSTML